MKKFYLETFGCQMNVSDSERVASQLVSDGFEVTGDQDAADVVLLNTCSIREKAEHKLYTRIGQIRKSRIDGKSEKPQLIGVLGCVAQLEGETLFKGKNEIDFVIGTKAIGRVSKAIDKAYKGEKGYFDLGNREDNYDWSVSEKHRHSPYIAFLPIIEGCNKFCTYCIVPFSRGREKSLSAVEIIKQIKLLQNQGVMEVHLIGQNVNSYRPNDINGMENFHGATPFARLLRAVAATGIQRIKFNTSFPRDFHTDIIDAINENENLCNWIHLPVQSGSDKVLREMRRGHRISSYLEKIDKIKTSDRKLSLTTDMIVGFPNESDTDFEDTLKLAEYCKFDSAYIFKYSPRPGTPASSMSNNIPESVKTQRFLELEKVIRKNQINIFKSYIGKNYQVLVEKFSSFRESELSGHTTCHKVVNFQGSKDLLGNIINLKITDAKTNTLYGEIC